MHGGAQQRERRAPRAARRLSFLYVILSLLLYTQMFTHCRSPKRKESQTKITKKSARAARSDAAGSVDVCVITCIIAQRESRAGVLSGPPPQRMQSAYLIIILCLHYQSEDEPGWPRGAHDVRDGGRHEGRGDIAPASLIECVLDAPDSCCAFCLLEEEERRGPRWATSGAC